MRARRVLAAATTTILALPSLARAGEPEAFPNRGPWPGDPTASPLAPEPPPPTPIATSRRWYGWQTLAVDLVAWKLHADTWDDSLGGSKNTAALYIGGTPLVHGLHGRWGRGFASMGFRFASESAALFFSLGCWESKEPHCIRNVARVVLAIQPLIEATLAWDEVPVYATAKKTTHHLTWMPALAPLPGRGALLGVTGAF